MDSLRQQTSKARRASASLLGLAKCAIHEDAANCNRLCAHRTGYIAVLNNNLYCMRDGGLYLNTPTYGPTIQGAANPLKCNLIAEKYPMGVVLQHKKLMWGERPRRVNCSFPEGVLDVIHLHCEDTPVEVSLGEHGRVRRVQYLPSISRVSVPTRIRRGCTYSFEMNYFDAFYIEMKNPLNLKVFKLDTLSKCTECHTVEDVVLTWYRGGVPRLMSESLVLQVENAVSHPFPHRAMSTMRWDDRGATRAQVLHLRNCGGVEDCGYPANDIDPYEDTDACECTAHITVEHISPQVLKQLKNKPGLTNNESIIYLPEGFGFEPGVLYCQLTERPPADGLRGDIAREFLFLPVSQFQFETPTYKLQELLGFMASSNRAVFGPLTRKIAELDEMIFSYRRALRFCLPSLAAQLRQMICYLSSRRARYATAYRDKVKYRASNAAVALQISLHPLELFKVMLPLILLRFEGDEVHPVTFISGGTLYAVVLEAAWALWRHGGTAFRFGLYQGIDLTYVYGESDWDQLDVVKRVALMDYVVVESEESNVIEECHGFLENL